MWICLNDGFYSAVQHENDPGLLVVRARREGDLERLFPEQEVLERDGSDYQFRVIVKRELFVEKMVGAVQAVDYPNFKDSVKSHRLHDAYAKVWAIMASLQARPPYGARKPAKA